MANAVQFKAAARIIATRGVKEYRETIPAVVRPDDHVLEVGCEWGTTTAVLARYAAHVIGTDISPKCVDRARTMRPGLDFRVLDAFDIKSVLDLGVPVTKVYMDLSGLSGYRGLLDLIALIQAYAGIVRPDTVVVKSGALKHFAQCCSPWQGATPPIGKAAQAGGSQPDGELPPPRLTPAPAPPAASAPASQRAGRRTHAA
jgi:SAM-dependent methyltransferase